MPLKMVKTITSISTYSSKHHSIHSAKQCPISYSHSRHLISSCMSQPMSLPKDVHFDGDGAASAATGAVATARLAAARSLFRACAVHVFELHGAVPLDAAATRLLLPANAQNPWRHLETSVQVPT